jgi:ParB/RepB/Spo0J family partition protein
MNLNEIEVGKIEKNPWNPNVMKEEEYEALKQDMHIHGVNGVDPILVSIKKIFYGSGPLTSEEYSGHGYVIIDGEHRWLAAKELGWKTIRAEVTSIREEEAKTLCYRRNRERGTIDPFKEAALFKSELGMMTQKAVAGKYGVDQSTVSHRLSLLKVDSEILKEIHELPRGIVTTSHLEPLATLHPDDQKQLANKIVKSAKHDPLSVKQVEDSAEWLREAREEAEQLKEALDKAKFPTCPKCGKVQDSINYKKLPWVNCSSGNYDHAWSLVSGKPVYEREPDERDPDKPKLPMTLRSAHTVQELGKVFVEVIKNVIGEDETLKIEKIDVSGTLQNSAFSFDVNTYNKSMSVSWHHGGAYLGFRAEEHDYKTGEKSAITTGCPADLERVKQLIENAFIGNLGVSQTEDEKKRESEEKEDLEEEIPA